MRLASICLLLLGCASDDASMSPDAPGTPDAPDAAPGTDIAAVPTGCATDRSLTDRPDDHGHDQIRILYVTPSDGADLARDTSGQICNSVRSFATWFHARSGAYLRFDTTSGLVDIGFVRLSSTDAQLKGSDPGNNTIDTGIAFVRERIERELTNRAMIAPNKAYAVYYEGSSSWACGAGAWPPLITARVAAMYLKGVPFGTTIDCGAPAWGRASLAPGYTDYAMLHEIVHTAGFVPDASPHEHASGHIFEPLTPTTSRDLMYSPRAQTNDPPWDIFAAEGLLLDVNNDDYFNTPAPADLDLATSSLLAPLAPNARRPIGW
ncbi:MAG: hypothetical protein M4D80_34615 [Myxococcota bacterium]|nr:hypothetical protein [Deltaproteobacteria bacterium]MDQ3340321.1 hypothetical protein [Myxococcota bacterium]